MKRVYMLYRDFKRERDYFQIHLTPRRDLSMYQKEEKEKSERRARRVILRQDRSRKV